jgi:hypothetical protein
MLGAIVGLAMGALTSVFGALSFLMGLVLIGIFVLRGYPEHLGHQEIESRIKHALDYFAVYPVLITSYLDVSEFRALWNSMREPYEQFLRGRMTLDMALEEVPRELRPVLRRCCVAGQATFVQAGLASFPVANTLQRYLESLDAPLDQSKISAAEEAIRYAMRGYPQLEWLLDTAKQIYTAPKPLDTKNNSADVFHTVGLRLPQLEWLLDTAKQTYTAPKPLDTKNNNADVFHTVGLRLPYCGPFGGPRALALFDSLELSTRDRAIVRQTYYTHDGDLINQDEIDEVVHVYQELWHEADIRYLSVNEVVVIVKKKQLELQIQQAKDALRAARTVLELAEAARRTAAAQKSSPQIRSYGSRKVMSNRD